MFVVEKSGNLLLSRWCGEIGVSIGEKEKQKILVYLRELIEWNQRANLVAKSCAEEIMRKHFIDSLACVSLLPEEKCLHVIDIGTGAGFPGLVLKIARPDIVICLLDASRKKCDFLKYVVSVLKLEGAEVVNGRAEVLGHMPEYRESFDVVVCRAVARLSIIYEYALPFLQLGGILIAQKGPAGIDEFEKGKDVLKILGGKFKESRECVLPCGSEKRINFSFRKERKTPSEYPRRNGVPARKPL